MSNQQTNIATYDPKFYFNLAMSSSITKILSDWDPKHGFNLQLAKSLFLMICAGAAYNIFNDMVQDTYSLAKTEFKPFCKGIYSYCKDYSSIMYNSLRNLLKKEKTQIQNNFNSEDNGYFSNIYKAELDNTFIQGLLNFLKFNHQTNIKINYKTSNDKFVSLKENVEITEKISDIRIEYQNMNIDFFTELEVKYSISGVNKRLLSYNSLGFSDERIVDRNKVKTLNTLISDPLVVSYIGCAYEKLPPLKCPDYCNFTKITDDNEIKHALNNLQFNKSSEFTSNITNSFEEAKKILYYAKKHFTSLSIVSIYEIIILIDFKISIGDTQLIKDGNIVLESIKIPFDNKCEIKMYHGINFSITGNFSIRSYLRNGSIIKHIETGSEVIIPNISSKDSIKFFGLYPNLNDVVSTYQEFVNKNKEQKINESFKILCSYKFETNNRENNISYIDTIFKKFTDDVKTFSFSNTSSKISTYFVKLEKERKIVKTPNPEYAIYQEESKKYSNVKSNDMASQICLKNFLEKPVPSEFIEEVEITKKIVTEKINDVYKDFNTMYLREEDEKKIKNVIDNFTINKEKMMKLGLPNKLCLLIDGPPGTGKSSTIITIATKLKRDIYYICWNGIDTNIDLKLIIDHVTLKCKGLIASEDIDGVGTFVHEREKKYSSETNVLNSQLEALSFDFFLNILQGSLTPDDLAIVFTTNHKEKLDKAFLRPLRMDASITLKKSDKYQFNKMFKNFIERDIKPEVLERIKEDEFLPAQGIERLTQFITNNDETDEVILSPFLNQ